MKLKNNKTKKPDNKLFYKVQIQNDTVNINKLIEEAGCDKVRNLLFILYLISYRILTYHQKMKKMEKKNILRMK